MLTTWLIIALTLQRVSGRPVHSLPPGRFTTSTCFNQSMPGLLGGNNLKPVLRLVCKELVSGPIGQQKKLYSLGTKIYISTLVLMIKNDSLFSTHAHTSGSRLASDFKNCGISFSMRDLCSDGVLDISFSLTAEAWGKRASSINRFLAGIRTYLKKTSPLLPKKLHSYLKLKAASKVQFLAHSLHFMPALS